MPKPPTIADIVRQLAELRDLIRAADALAVHVALRLDRHVESSGAVHRELRGRLSQLEELVHDMLRQQPPST